MAGRYRNHVLESRSDKKVERIDHPPSGMPSTSEYPEPQRLDSLGRACTGKTWEQRRRATLEAEVVSVGSRPMMTAIPLPARLHHGSS